MLSAYRRLIKVFISNLKRSIGLNIFDLYTLYIEQHIKTYNNIQFLYTTKGYVWFVWFELDT